MLAVDLRVSEALRRFKAREIYDETDRDTLGVHPAPDGTIPLPGTFLIHALPDLGVDLGDAPKATATIAGLVLSAPGDIPDAPGDQVRLDRRGHRRGRERHHRRSAPPKPATPSRTG